MSNSILSSLPSLHGTMLSIIVGFFTAYALYAYQTTNSAVEKIESLKRQVQNLSQPNFEGGLNYDEYLNDDGLLDWQRIKKELWDITSVFSYLDFEKYGYKRQPDSVDKAVIENTARKLMGLTGLISSTYPYLGKSHFKKKKVKKEVEASEWIADLSQNNGYLLWLWDTHSRGLNELMEQYREIDIKSQKERHEKSLQEFVAQSTKDGHPPTQEELARIKNEFHVVIETDYGLYLREFFSKLIFIEKQIIPQLKENQIVLETQQNKHKIKTRSLWVLVISVFIFIFGIIIPLIISAYPTPPFIGSLEITLLVGTTAPYLFGLLYLIRIVSSLHQQ